MKSVNVDHYRKGLKPHVHRGYYHKEYDPKEQRLALTPEKKLVAAISKSWDSARGGS